jgi:hypothetical protein
MVENGIKGDLLDVFRVPITSLLSRFHNYHTYYYYYYDTTATMRCSLIYVLPLLVTTGVFAAPTHDEGGEFSVRDHRDALEERGMDGMDHFEERDHLIDLDERDELDLDERGEFSVADHRAALEKRGVVAFDLDARGVSSQYSVPLHQY